MWVPREYLKNAPAIHILCPQYRLATHQKSRFPVQLQDAITSYAYLIHTLRIPASRIILSSDSSGTHLALALVRYIDEFKKYNLPVPKCSWLWSPWCEVPAAMDTHAWRTSENYKTEYIPGSFPARGAKLLLGDLEITKDRERYLAPLWHPFRVASPVLVITGNREVLFHEHEKLAEVLGEQVDGELDPGVELVVADKVPHDVLMIGWVMDFKEARDCAIKAGEFVNRIGISC